MRELTRNEKYALVSFVLVLTLAVIIYLNRPVTPDVAKITLDPAFYGNVLQSPVVVFRLVYPFSNVQGAGQAAVFASDVLVFKRKTVILQVIDGNTCTETVLSPANATDTNKQTSVVSTAQCYADAFHYPVIMVREGPSAELTVTDAEATISGDSHQVYVLTKYLLTRIWPDAEDVFLKTQKVLANVRRQ